MSRLLRWVLSLLLVWLLASCGYKGALYLPDQHPTSTGQAPSAAGAKGLVMVG